jgi:hypothetical protein
VEQQVGQTLDMWCGIHAKINFTDLFLSYNSKLPVNTPFTGDIYRHICKCLFLHRQDVAIFSVYRCYSKRQWWVYNLALPLRLSSSPLLSLSLSLYAYSDPVHIIHSSKVVSI